MIDTSPIREDFRLAMRGAAASVTLLTAADSERRHGMTATAVMSLSFDPPSLLVCINRRTAFHEMVALTGKFCVNVLDTEHLELPGIFAGALPPEERFGHGVWLSGEGGIPYLEGAQANIFCTTDKVVDYGTHAVFFARVDRVINAADVRPLVYNNGSYARCVPLAEQWVQ